MDFNAIVFYQDECSKEELTALDIKNSFYQSFGTSSKLKIGDLVIQIKYRFFCCKKYRYLSI